MKIKIITILGYKIDFVKTGIDYYKNKIVHFSNIEILIAQMKDNFASKEEKLKKQGEAVLKLIKEKDFVVLCDVNGKIFNSVEFAREFEKMMNLSRDIIFVIGSDEGIGKGVFERANLKISFSQMTFNHELFFVILLEQIYRAFNIIKNYPYHK